jgi:hypothetical protein
MSDHVQQHAPFSSRPVYQDKTERHTLLQFVWRLLPSPISEPSVHLGLRRHQILEFGMQGLSPVREAVFLAENVGSPNDIENDPLTKARIPAFAQALADLGWTYGRNVRIDLRWTGDDTIR